MASQRYVLSKHAIGDRDASGGMSSGMDGKRHTLHCGARFKTSVSNDSSALDPRLYTVQSGLSVNSPLMSQIHLPAVTLHMSQAGRGGPETLFTNHSTSTATTPTALVQRRQHTWIKRVFKQGAAPASHLRPISRLSSPHLHRSPREGQTGPIAVAE